MSNVAIGVLPDFDTGNLIKGTPLVFVPRPYLIAVRQWSGQPVVLPPIRDEVEAMDYLALVRGVLLTGGTTPLADAVRQATVLPPLEELNPERYASERAYVRAARRLGLPVMGVCRGMQVLNEVLGGVMDYRRLGTGDSRDHYQQADEAVGTHAVDIVEGTRLDNAVHHRRITTNSFHRTAVVTPAPGLRIVARATDGVVEAVEAEHGPWVIGVQFHPELMPMEDASRGVYQAFVQAARVARPV